MRIAVPKEVKNHEYRVGLVPGGAAALVTDGHEVLIERGAGEGSGIPDASYEAVGCRIVDDVDALWSAADLVIKVKEPVAVEYPRMQEGQVVYTYFHLAAEPALARALVERSITAVAYETIQTADGALPLLQPMSEVAGRMAVQVGARCLEKEAGGRGVLLGGVAGVRSGKVVILGGGTVGTEAAKIAIGMGAQVTVLDVNLQRLRVLDDLFGNRMTTLFSNQQTIRDELRSADLVIGAVLIPGARAPHLVREEELRQMADGAVVVDVSVDQGGCIETCRPTTHDEPTYVVYGVVHYCVTNMPGAVARTSTYALTNATIPYARALASRGVAEAVRADRSLAMGVNAHAGTITYEAVARDLGMTYRPLSEVL